MEQLTGIHAAAVPQVPDGVQHTSMQSGSPPEASAYNYRHILVEE